MFRKPTSITSLYGVSILLSIFLVLCIRLVTTAPLFIFISLFTPQFFVTLRLVLLSKEYTEENLTNIEKDVFWSFIAVGVFFSFIGVVFLQEIASVVIIPFVFLTTYAPYWLLSKYIGSTYSKIEFGFREALPDSHLWKGALICLHNARNAKTEFQKYVWYELASLRFATVVQSIDSTVPYSNAAIAGRYKSATDRLARKYSPYQSTDDTVFESILDSILIDFTQQNCKRCGKTHSVSNMYVLTENGVISEIYCEECIESQTPSSQPSSQHTQPTEQTTEQTTSQAGETDEKTHNKTTSESSQQSTTHPNSQTDEYTPQQALEILELSDETLETLTSEKLKSQYRTLVHTHHPDRGGNSEKFKSIVSAYEQLSDELN